MKISLLLFFDSHFARAQEIGYLGIVNSSNIMVTSLVLTNKWQGIQLAFTTDSIIQNVTVSSNGVGIRLVCTKNITMKNNIASMNGHGIYLTSSSNNLVVGNTLLNNVNGISIDHANSTMVRENTISENEVGIAIDGGTELGGGKNNIIYHNNFVNNPNQTILYFVDPSDNVWDNGYEGNYWSDYNGTDTNGDGIGDTELPWWSVDHYPLMGPFTDFPVPYQAKTYHVTTICNSTISDFNYTPKTISFNVIGQDGTVGFCRIMIPRVLVGEEPYEVLVDGMPISYSMLPCSNSTHVFLYYTYIHSIHKIAIKGTPTIPVGGVWVPVNKFELLAPWLALTSLIILAAVSVDYMKHRKKKQT